MSSTLTGVSPCVIPSHLDWSDQMMSAFLGPERIRMFSLQSHGLEMFMKLAEGHFDPKFVIFHAFYENHNTDDQFDQGIDRTPFQK